MREIIHDYTYKSTLDVVYQDTKEFFEWQKAIVEDFKRIKQIISNFKPSKEKDSFERRIDEVILSLPKNNSEYEMDLRILIYSDYAIFSYYPYYGDGDTPICDTPTKVIMDRNIEKIIFVDEEYSVFYEEEANDEYNRGHQYIVEYIINQKEKEITKLETEVEEYTGNMIDNCFYKPDSIESVYLK